MDKIKKVSELPEWFFNQVYRKQLSDIDWYRKLTLWITLHIYFFKIFRGKQNYQSIGKSRHSDFITQWLLCAAISTGQRNTLSLD